MGIRPSIGFVCSDLQRGVEFYKEFELLMAKSWPDEAQRPMVYAEFGLDPNSTSDIVHSENCDYIFEITALLRETEDTSVQELTKTLLAQSGKQMTEEELKPLFGKIKVYQPSNLLELDNKKTINVIGGMGPIAGANFLGSLINELKQIDKAQDTKLKLYSNPQRPDKYKARDILEAILHAINYILRFRHFVNHSKGVLVAPGNTFHTNLPFLGFITKINEKILHIVKQVETKMFSVDSGLIAVMGTERTVARKLYEGIFQGSGKEIFSLSQHPEYRQKVQEGINFVKAGEIARGGECFRAVIEFIQKNTPQGTPIIFGCTEIIVGCKAVGINLMPPIYDSAEILAHAAAQKILITPLDKPNKIFTEKRNIADFLASAKQKLVRFKLKDIGGDRTIEASCQNFIRKISELQTSTRPVGLNEYQSLFFEMIDYCKKASMQDNLKAILAEIVYNEIAKYPEQMSEEMLKECQNNIIEYSITYGGVTKHQMLGDLDSAIDPFIQL